MYTVLYPVNELKIGGAEQQLLELVRGLDKTQFHPIVAPLYPGGSLDAEFRAVPGIEIVDLRRRGKLDPSPLWRIMRLLRQRRIDIVQPFLSPATFFGLVPAFLSRAPVTIVTERCGARRVRGIGYRTYRTVEDWLSRLADAIVPNSLAGQEMLLERGLPVGKIRLIYNGINPERLRLDPAAVAAHRARLNVPDDGAVIGILASLTPPKGHNTLLRAMAIVRQTHPGVRLAIVGDGPSRPALEGLVDELGLTQHVVFFGYQRAVADFLGCFNLLVSASVDNEGCSNSILEAMALGVPVIATDIGGNRELVHDWVTGFLVAAGDPQALATVVNQVLESPDESRAVANHAKEMVRERFSLSAMVSGYVSLYRSLTREPTSASPRGLHRPRRRGAPLTR